MTTVHFRHARRALRVPRSVLVLGALAIVYFTWGSTYLAIRVAVQHVPPFLLAGTRFVAAGVILYAFLRLRGAKRPTLKEWSAASVVGVATFVASHGLLAWASQFVPSGTAALLAAASPAWIAIGGALGLVAGQRTSALALAGTALGLAGVAVAADPAGILAGGASLAAIAALLAGSLAWAIGSVLARWSALPRSAPLTASMSMLTGGTMLLGLSAALAEPTRLNVALVPAAAWGALAYLILAGSVVAYSAYVWLLREDGPARVSAHAFVNPLVAVALGAAIAGEPLTRITLLAAALVVSGVGLMNVAPRLALARARKAEAAVPTRPRGCAGC